VLCIDGSGMQSIPHFYVKRAARIDALLALRAQFNAVLDQKISVNDPVLRSVETTSLGEIARSVKEFVQLANAGKLQQRNLEGGSISVTNLGMYGVDEFSAIINPLMRRSWPWVRADPPPPWWMVSWTWRHR